MRRFEFSEGSSHKFWQVEVADSSTTVTYGKIGTAGQTQTKTFATPAAATAEANKLVREKTKKGYVEVAADPAPAIRAAPKPSAPTPAPAAPTRAAVVWTPAAKALLDAEKSATWGWGGKRPLPSFKSGDAIAKAIARAKDSLVRGSALADPPMRDLMARVVTAFVVAANAPDAVNDPELEAAAATLLPDEQAGAAFASRWLAAGPAAAFTNLARMWQFRREYQGYDDNKPTWLAKVAPDTNWDSSVCGAKSTVTAYLAAAVAEMSPAERAAARDAASAIRDQAALPVRIHLAVVFDEGSWAAEDVDPILALGTSASPIDAKILVPVLRDADALERLVARVRFDHHFRPASVAEKIGLPAASILAKYLAQTTYKPYAINAATVLAALECETTAKALVGYLGTKGVDEVAREFFTRRPDLGLAALGTVIAGRGKDAAYAEPIAQSILRARPGILDELGSALDPRTASALASLRGAADDDVEEATMDALPRVLSSPPWLAKRTFLAAPLLEGLATLPFVESVEFDASTRALRRTPHLGREAMRRWFVTGGSFEDPSPAMDARVVEKMYSADRFLSGWLDLMTDDGARSFLTTKGLAAFFLEVSELEYLLARFDRDAIPWVLGAPDAHVVGAALLHVASPRAATFLAEALSRAPKKLRAAARAYFAKYPEASAIGLLPVALAKATQKWALPALQLLAGSHEATLREVAARYGAEALATIDGLLGFEPPRKVPTLPAWFDPAALPPILLRSERRLPPDAVRHVGTLLAMSEPSDAHPRLDEVKESCTPDSLGRFAWGLFQTWLSEGASSKEDWAMTALGHLGDDEAARRFTPLVRAWPGEAAHARAVKGLEVLAQIGSDIALMHLDAIAEKVKFKGLQEKARAKIELVAVTRGLSREELADRIAPTLDLDDGGSKTLSFGPRNFKVGFDEHLTPYVVDDNGKRSGDLPKPKASDDAERAALAVQTWKTLKKDAKAVAASQLMRLERAMCSKRRWRAADFRTLLVEHPLVGHIVRRLLWATYEGDVPRQPFRVAEDRTLSDVDDAAIVIADDATVGLVHRLDLEGALVGRWASIFADYELLQPFAQLDREVYPLLETERTSREITRFSGVEAPTGKVLGLEAKGWRRGAPQDAGVIHEMEKPLPGDLRAELPIGGGLYAGAMAESPSTQTLSTIVVRRGSGGWGGEPVALGDLDPLVFSELVRDVEALRP